MGKIKVHKDVFDYMIGKLQASNKLEKSAANIGIMSENDIINTEFAEKVQNKAEKTENKQITSKLEASKNIFSRGDFDKYKISDDELREHEDIEKAHKYIRRWKMNNGEWRYEYPKEFDKTIHSFRDVTTALTNRTTEIKGIQPLTTEKQIDAELERLTKLSEEGKLTCPALGNANIYIEDMTTEHAEKTNNVFRTADARIHKLQYLSFVEPILKNGILYMKSRKYNHTWTLDKVPERERTTYGIINKVTYTDTRHNNKQVTCGLEIVVAWDAERKRFVFSFINRDIKKSLLLSKDIKTTAFEVGQVGACNTEALSTTDSIIAHPLNLSSKNVTKSLTYSGYKLQGRTRLYGMNISIENKKGSYRSGTDKDGHKWKTLMHFDYGYIRGTEGVDGDHVDCYIGTDKKSEKVYVIHQNDPVTHNYDEDKCMLCFASAADAKKAYMKQYDRPGFFGSMETLTIDQFKSYVFSHLGKKIHKSFDIQITDITENNKQQKLEQFNKALNAIADNRPFIIKHIPADNSPKIESLTVRLMNFDRNKIEKAVHKVALSLDADVLASSKGESFVYESQKEITENFYKRVTNSARAIYDFVINYFDLPDIRVISKAGELRHKGKILYNPETGKPIKESEWKRFIVELEKYLNRNYTGVGEKIVLSAESLGIILDRLSKTNSFDAIRKMSLSELKAKRYDIDWISESIRNMHDKFGEAITRERQARIQIACDSAAQRVTRVKDDMRNNIQQIIIDGIRDKQSKSVVAQNLFDKCASLNRDMQRIADSEVQMAANSAYCKEEVYNTKPGEKVYFKRFEMNDDNTCKACKKLNGTIAIWSDVPLPDEHVRDPFAKYAIWDGKNEGNCPVGIVHPYCYSDDTEVMTNNGWKLFKDVEKNDKIMSINPETKEIDFVSYVQKIQYEYNGDMIHFPGRNYDMLVTPDHNMLYLAGNGHGDRQLKGIKASELIKNVAFALPRAVGEWKHTDTKTVKFGDLTISKAQYFRLWAWYLAEGNGRNRNGGYEVKLTQKDPMKIYNDLPELQSILHIGEEAVYIMGDYARYFECMFGIYADKKFIPPFIKNSSVENIREFLDAFVMADGTRLTNHKCSSNKAYSEFRNEQVLRTSSKKMADDLCEMIVKAGWMPSEYVVQEKGKLVHFENGDYVLNTDCHNISICKSKTRTYAPDTEGHKPRHKPAYEKYSGMVYDVELEKWHFLLVRRNGKCGWSGNCRGSWIRYYPELS